MTALPHTRRQAAEVLRGAARLILERGLEPTPAHAWRWTPNPGCAVDVANAMSLTRFGVYATGGWQGKAWRCQDRPYRVAHDRLLQYLMGHHHSDVCGWNAAVPRAREVVAVLFGVAEDLHRGDAPIVAGRVPVLARVEAWRREIDRRVDSGVINPPGLRPEDVVLTGVVVEPHALTRGGER